jgi:hypothetical protein
MPRTPRHQLIILNRRIKRQANPMPWTVRQGIDPNRAISEVWKN